MSAVWYPTEALQGTGKALDMYGFVLVTVLLLESLVHIGKRRQF